MNMNEYKAFYKWLKGIVDINTITVASAAVYISHWKDGKKQGIY